MAAESRGIESDLICLRNLNIKQCTGCESCMRSLIDGKGGSCVIRDDDYGWLMDRMTEADGLILAAPIYDLIPCGRLITLLNRALGAGKARRDACRAHPKISAAIAVGGSDWIDMTEPLLQISLTNLCKGTIVVDRIVCGFNTAPAMAVLDDALLERARLLGERVAAGMLSHSEAVYQGNHGSCPVCNCSLIRPLGGKKAMCAFCGVKGTMELEDEELRFICTPEAMTHQRFGLQGEREHQEDIRMAHRKAFANRAEIAEKRKKYAEFGHVIRPDLAEEGGDL